MSLVWLALVTEFTFDHLLIRLHMPLDHLHIMDVRGFILRSSFYKSSSFSDIPLPRKRNARDYTVRPAPGLGAVW